MTPTFIWGIAALLYVGFWFWYIGISRKITSDEVESTINLLQTRSNYSVKQIDAIRHFFEQDDGKDFVMVNLLELKEPMQQSRKNLCRRLVRRSDGLHQFASRCNYCVFEVN